MFLFMIPVVVLGYLATKYSGLSGFVIWPSVTAIVLIFGLSFFNVDKSVLGVSVKNKGLFGRAITIFFMALLAEVLYTSYWLTDSLFHWVSQQGTTL